MNDLLLPANGGVAPNGTVYPQITGNDALTTYRNSLEKIVALQQLNSGNNVKFPPQLFYVLNVRQAFHDFHPEMTALTEKKRGSIIWGYDGIYPGPTFMSGYGVPFLVRIFNRLFDDQAANGFTPGIPTPGGFGNPQISTHLHNGHTGSESDGNPADIYPPTKPSDEYPQYPPSIMAIRFRDHHYGMFRAGLNPRRAPHMRAPNVKDGDITETVSSLWYHDHSMEHTAENVYKGLVGFHLFFDEVDSGDENDPAPGALRLPSGDFDVPLLFQDKRFDANGQLFLDPLSLNHDGFLGDTFVVNGRIQPKLAVMRRKYRFRLLNAGPSRFYQFFLTAKDDVTNQLVDHSFIQIGNDESLLEQPVKVDNGVLVAERADVIIDFSHFKKGDHVYLENRLVMQDDGTGPTFDTDEDGNFLKYIGRNPGEGDQLLRFVVGDDAPDPSQILATLRANPPLPKWTEKTPAELKLLKVHKSFVFTKSASGEWVINKQSFDTSPSTMIRQNPLRGDDIENPPLADEDENRRPDGEVWTIQNAGDSTWSHPVHIHIEDFRILWRKKHPKAVPEPPPPHERCRKDVLRINPQEEVQIFLRFRDFLGKYPLHCHNVLHEDESMMLRFDVVGVM